MPPKASDFSDRTRQLIGDDGVARLKRARVMVVGLGGVGGYALEQLARAGVGHLVIVDGDRIEASNRNRQLIALTGTEGELKTAAWERRLRDINPDIRVAAIAEFIDRERSRELLAEPCDYAVEAIDSLSPKIGFILEALARGCPFISSMGSGGRCDPLQVRRCDIGKTHHCALARAVRGGLRRHGVDRGVEVVFSPEAVPPHAVRPCEDERHASSVGTLPMVPAAFGIACAAAALEHLLRQQ